MRDLKQTNNRVGLAIACSVMCALPLAFGQTNVNVAAPAEGKAETGAIVQSTNPPSAAGAQPTGKAAAQTTRRLEGEEVRQMLAEALERQLGKNGGQLEIKLARSWTPITVPTGPLAVEIVEPPLNRLSSLCVVRFEVLSGKELVGTWQACLQCRLWREVLVARSTLQRGATLSESDFDKEKRDILMLNEAVCELPSAASGCELTQNVPLGTVLTARAVRLKPVVFRGQTADGIVRDGTMMISLKVEVLEEGVPGQMVRVRNAQSRRELRGKVEDEQTILIPL